MQDHPGFNGFTQTHFVRQQHARRMAAANVMGDVQLMGDQAGALAAQAAPRHTVLLALVPAGAIAQGKAIHTVDLSGEQAVLRLAEDQLAVEQHFPQHHVGFLGINTGAGIRQQPFFLFHIVNVQLPAFVAGHRVARVEHDAGDGRVVTRVQTVFTGCREKESDHARVQRYDCP